MQRAHTIQLLFGFILIASIACGRSPGEGTYRLAIVGGEKATGSEFLSAVAFESTVDGKTFCSGTLVHPELVVTSAHCLTDKKKTEFKVRMARGETFAARAMLSYKPEQKYGVNFDIAWVRLEQAADGYEPIEILRDGKALVKQKKTKAEAAGYGQKQSDCYENNPDCDTGELRKSSVSIKEYVNEGRWFHLLLTESPEGTGPCLGDSGGPLFVDIEGQRFLAGNFVGWDQRLVKEDRSKICDRGQAIYNFTGGFREWIETSSGLQLPLSESLNKEAAPPENPLTVRDPTRFEDWCESRDEKDRSWYTIQRLVSLAGDYALEHGGDIRRVFSDCAYAKSNLENKIRLDQGLFLDAFAPDSFGKEASITDLRPFLSLRTFGIKKLQLAGHAIDDFTVLSALPNLKSLEISNNQGDVKGSLDLSQPFALEQISIKNSPKAVLLETLSEVRTLKTLSLERSTKLFMCFS